MAKRIAICALFTVVMVFSACGVAFAYTGGGAGGTSGDYVISLTVTPTTTTVYAGNTQKFTAIATILDTETGTTTDEDRSDAVEWQSTIGDIDDGLFTAHKVGTGTIKAIYGAASAEVIIRVNHGPVEYINITANSTELVRSEDLTQNVPIPFGLKGVDDENNKIPIADAHWSCSNATLGSITQTGVFKFNEGVITGTGKCNRNFLDLTGAAAASGWISVTDFTAIVNETKIYFNQTGGSSIVGHLIADTNGSHSPDYVNGLFIANGTATQTAINITYTINNYTATKDIFSAACSDSMVTVTAKTAGVDANKYSIEEYSNGIETGDLTGGVSKYTMTVTASVSANTSSTVNLTFYVNDPVGNDNVTSDNILENPVETTSADFVDSLMAIQVMAANDWNFGHVYPGIPTGWSEVTFKNIGTCNVRVTPDAPFGASDNNAFNYVYFRDYGSTGDGAKMGSYSIDIQITPIYDNFGRIVSFSSETKIVEMRLSLPATLSEIENEGRMRHILTTI